jgi:beta-barrel assembly-enhancing protease
MKWRALAMMGALLWSVGAGAETVKFTRPPYAGAYEPQGVDERGLWMDVDEYERTLNASPEVLRDPQLTAFVKDVLCRAVGTDRCAGVRVYVIKDRSFNASMAPNGLMRVHTGLLARLHSEAELAAVLGHEFAHFEERHTLKKFLLQRRTSDWVHWLALAGAATAVNTSDVRRDLTISVYAFSRAEESQADALGGSFVLASSYRLCAGEVWHRAIEEDDALRRERGLKIVRRQEPSLTDTHPPTEQRLHYFAEIEKTSGERGEDGRERYRNETDRVLPTLFEPLVKGNDFAVADYVVRSRGETLGWSAALLTLRGELYRQRGNPRDLASARDFFTQAVATGSAPPEALRGLGLVDMRLGDAAAGRAALADYLRQAPSAADAGPVRMLLGE